MSQLQAVEVTEDEADIRLDRWFKRHFPALTHGQLQKLLRTGQVRIDGKRAKADSRLKAGQSIRVPPQVAQPQSKAQKEKTSSRISSKLKNLVLYEDDDVIVINKPSGLAVQGGTGLKENLDDMLKHWGGESGKPKLVHRLDRDTSGVLILGRTSFAASKLTEAFRERSTQKIYWAITVGVPKPLRGTISAPLVKYDEIMYVAEPDEDKEGAKQAVTNYETAGKAENHAAFVILHPITGRTHQLRVHMAHIGTPILGDPLYSPGTNSSLPLKELGKGLHLHARRLAIPHPRRGTIDIMAPLGDEMRKTFKWFGFSEGT